MTSNDYLKLLKDRYRNYFDIIEKEHPVINDGFNFIATYNVRGEKYIFSPKVKLYAVEEFEHCLIKVFNTKITIKLIDQFKEKIISHIDTLVHPGPDHMKTYLTGVLIAEKGYDVLVEKYINKTRYQRSFKFGFGGWCEVRLVLVDLLQERILHHRRERKMKENYCFC